MDSSSSGILVALGVVATAGVGGAAYAPSSAVNILGFCCMICVSLLTLLKQNQASAELRVTQKQTAAEVKVAAVKVEEVKTELATKMQTAAAKVEEVKTELEEARKVHQDHEEVSKATASSLQELLPIVRETRTLVNHNMEVQLKISAVALRELAGFEPTAQREAAAVVAETLLQEHVVKQAEADAKG